MFVCCGAQAVEAVSSDAFWAQLQSLCSLLAPFAQAVALVQSRRATLADIVMHLLQLANLLEASKADGVVQSGESCKYCLLYCVQLCPLHASSCRAAHRQFEVCTYTQTCSTGRRLCLPAVLLEHPSHSLASSDLLHVAHQVWGVVDADFVAHCSEVYHERMAELDGELCRLALLLHPQYKMIASPHGNASPLIHKVLTSGHPFRL